MKTLKGCPKTINGNFHCNDCQNIDYDTEEYKPQIIKGNIKK